MFEWLGTLGKNFGVHKAVDFAVNWLQSDSGKKVAEQQVTGFLGLSKVDEGIMAHLMSKLRQFYPGEYAAVSDFLNTLTDAERSRIREILGMIQVLPPMTRKIRIPVFGSDGKQVIEGGKPKWEENVVSPTVEFTREDPRLIILVQLGRCIQSAPDQATGITMGKQMLVVTGMLLDKTVLQRIHSALTESREKLTKTICAAFGAQDSAQLLVIINDKVGEWEQELEHKRRLGFLGWLLNKKPYTLFYLILGICAVIWLAGILATTKPF